MSNTRSNSSGDCKGDPPSSQLPCADRRWLEFNNGKAIGTSQRWLGGQYCSIITPVGIVGCGIYDLETAHNFGQAIAISRGTIARPLTEPEDLLEAKIVDMTPEAAEIGITPGMTGRDAVELMLQTAKLRFEQAETT